MTCIRQKKKYLKHLCKKFLPSTRIQHLSNYISAQSGLCPFRTVSIWGRFYSGSYPFGIVSSRDCTHSGLCPFGKVFIRDRANSGSRAIGMVSNRNAVRSGLYPFGIVSIPLLSYRRRHPQYKTKA